GGESATTLVPKYENLLVVQTFSKSRALAGLRVGFAIGQRPLIEALERVKDSFNSYPLGRTAQAGAIAAIKDEAWFEETRGKIIASRAALTAELEKRGFAVLPSQANFIFARHPDHAGQTLAAKLRERAVIVRRFAKPRISDFLRITVGTDAECARLIAALDEIL
ncbi:MAG TPA: aminotransferase class I/II-fold pyridoxal phosphate-dependent enzyme, partial [Sinorhizobium sp.]|nr:aminotransferase class I/II-fold pyridoxal phosphate-dependent enzyme [Sinorhizobium sp.]